LGSAVDDILHRHDYPPPVSALLGEAIALTAMLGSALKFEGKFILQAKGDGPVDILVADYSTSGGMRGYARFDSLVADKLSGTSDELPANLLGNGHLAMTIDQGTDMERYQGIVALEGRSLSEVAHEYFQRSEQIPTRVMLAAGPLMGRGRSAREAWRAGGILIQHLPQTGPSSPLRLSSGDAPAGAIEPHLEDDRWIEARLLADTVEEHELLDPTISPERLLYRLFHERGVTIYRAQAVKSECTCSRERIAAVLKGFARTEREEMRQGNLINVTCEFCSTRYSFTLEEIENLS
jgi:molecular chaperone Hsp33